MFDYIILLSIGCILLGLFCIILHFKYIRLLKAHMELRLHVYKHLHH
jgi:hypothetical protein